MNLFILPTSYKEEISWNQTFILRIKPRLLRTAIYSYDLKKKFTGAIPVTNFFIAAMRAPRPPRHPTAGGDRGRRCQTWIIEVEQ